MSSQSREYIRKFGVKTGFGAADFNQLLDLEKSEFVDEFRVIEARSLQPEGDHSLVDDQEQFRPRSTSVVAKSDSDVSSLNNCSPTLVYHALSECSHEERANMMVVLYLRADSQNELDSRVTGLKAELEDKPLDLCNINETDIESTYEGMQYDCNILLPRNQADKLLDRGLQDRNA